MRRVSLKLVLPLMAAVVLMVGGGIALLPGSGVEVPLASSAASPAPAPGPPKLLYNPGDPPRRLDSFGQLFLKGVTYLSERRFHEAVIVFTEATRQRPQLPEAFVNLGFANLGTQTWISAREAFERALELRKDQLNAYYGLAIAFDELGELEASVGAMRAYAHLAPRDSADARKAWAALWELEDRLRRQRGDPPADEGAQ